MLNISLTSFFSAKKTYLEDLSLKRSSLPRIHGIPLWRCTTTEFQLPYCWKFVLRLSFCQHEQCCNNIFILASNFLQQRKVESQRLFFHMQCCPSLCSSSNDLRGQHCDSGVCKRPEFPPSMGTADGPK